jgi:SlyX protein
MNEITDKIIELETKMAFQEATIDQLNDVIISQQKALDAIKQQLIQLNTKVEEESQHWQSDNNPVDETPPHY